MEKSEIKALILKYKQELAEEAASPADILKDTILEACSEAALRINDAIESDEDNTSAIVDALRDAVNGLPFIK